jgi:hypothetical protein
MYIVIPVNTILGCWFIYNLCEGNLQIHFVGNKKKLRIYIDTKPNKCIHLRWANSLRPTQVLSELLVAQSCVFCVVFCGLLFVFSSFLSMVIVLSGLCIIWPLYYLAFVLYGLCIIWPLYYHGLCIIWPLYYQAFVLSGLCIIRPLYYLAFVLSGLCIIMAIVLSGICII